MIASAKLVVVHPEPAAPHLDDVLAQQRDYYAQRAAEYHDDAYTRTRRSPDANAEWRADMARLRDAFDRVDIRGDVLELAGGTGAWTERIAGRATTLTVIDASAEMLEQNRRRLGDVAAHIIYEVADLFTWQPDRTWDACVFGFWLAKVPDSLLQRFLRSVHSALRPGGTVCCVDKTTDAARTTEYEERTLQSGARFTIVDRPRTPDEISGAFAAAGMNVSVETFGPRFSLTVGTRD